MWNKFLRWIKNNRLEFMYSLYYIFETYKYITAISQGKQTWLTSKTIDFNDISVMMNGLFHIILGGFCLYSLSTQKLKKEITDLERLEA
jgi:hypothetical protein